MEPTVVMHLRIPRELATDLKKVAAEGGYSLGYALKYIIDNAQNTRLEEKIEELNKRFLFLEANTIIEDILNHELFCHILEKDITELPVAQLSRLRKAKANLEMVGDTNSNYYKFVCAQLYQYGEEKRDVTPQMLKNFKEFMKSAKRLKEAKKERGQPKS